MPEIVKQITRTDGKRRLTVCLRDDDLFFYQEDWFSEWDDVPNDWRDGYPISGLFASAAEAEAEARATISWLRHL